MIRKLLRKVFTRAASPVQAEPALIPVARHGITREQLSPAARKVCAVLQEKGHKAYVVGGAVRDLLIGHPPKDYDVATSATPEEVRALFRRSRIIGRRFRLAHVHFGREVIEVATFRGTGEAQNDEQVLNKEGRLLRDNVYGTIEEDVWRRDFTVNALYYNIKDFSVVDYTGGMDDHKAGVLRLIGDPETRFREDPVRMIRAVRFAVKLGFHIDPACEKSIHDVAPLLASIPAARLYDEALKLFLSGYALQTFEMLRHYGLFQVLFPATENSLAVEDQGFPRLLLIKALENSDNRIAEGKTVTAYFLFAAFLWDAVQIRAQHKLAKGAPEFLAYQEAANEVIAMQVKSTALPRHITLAMREVWSLQPKFNARIGSKPSRLITHPRFRAAYDFLLLRAQTGGAEMEVAKWWEIYQNANENEQRKMTAPPRNAKTSKAPRKRVYRKKTTTNVTSSE